MPRHEEKRVLPYTPQQLFDIVIDIERYPEFLPWCTGARITERSGNKVLADLIIGYKMFQEQFTSDVTLDAPNSIKVNYVAGPLTHLTNEWNFKPAGQGCELSFHVDFDFHSPMLRAIIEPFFDKTILKMADAFEERAKVLYS